VLDWPVGLAEGRDPSRPPQIRASLLTPRPFDAGGDGRT